ncbi:autotransporter domain-containing protein [Polaromonas sp. CG_9.11]|uniref:autotransporter domain-containing protein n=1 Tax=Polaromonas sp. CG_9.11 TaxID=2787730 RepID=UPI0018CB5C88|nr:autotransporter domain-containing protein [Polaromonas sp. CG_9.11]MBG6076847.1 outer membrane autotransporter protein [Polaromonas sp. CG_9.11]
MNQIYSLVLNHATGACQAVSEVAKGSHKAASATGSEACSPRRTRLASACLIALATLAGTSAWAQDTSGSITGAPGTNGSVGITTGTNGTAGADAVQTISDGTHSGVLTGGVGGTGGSGTLLGGDGGSGGAGLSNAVNNVGVYNTGSIQGGQGGDGGNGLTLGLGGAGGNGVLITAPTRLFINDGIIEGGRGGLGSPTPSAGGVGVSATVTTSFENSGTVRGGLSGDGLSRADAIRFTDDNNFLGLISTSVIEGNVIGSLSNSDTLGLAGSTDASFNTALIGPTGQYRNFAGFQKLGTNTWTLTGNTTALTPWQIFSGTLAISSDANLGDAAGLLTLNGGTLRSTADIITNRAMVLGQGGTLETDAGTTYTSNGVMSGLGGLTKTGAGTAIFTADNTYTGGTAITAGTLQLGNGGTTGYIAGDVVNNARLAFNRSDTVLFESAISGSGSVEQRGTGTTKLAATNTYTGTTTISAGTLELGNGGTIGSIVGDVVNSGTLAFNRSDATVFDGVISGSGNVEQRGAGTTTLAATNTYTGGTAIGTGTLELGNGGTIGSIVGDVANSGTLAFNRSDASVFERVISGTGKVEQRGTGTTTLTGANAYTGGTTISAGTLELGNGGTTGAIAGDVMNNSTLAFNRSDATVFNGAISGTGGVQQRGTGTTTLTGANTYTGGTTITAGTLALGNGGTTGAIVGNVTNNAILAFNRSDAIAFDGAIAGTGSVEQRGTGTTTLSGVNTYSGGTFVVNGTLAGSAASLGSGAIVNNAALVVDQASDAALNNVFSGAGRITKTGAGALTLGGNSAAFAGSTQVTAGTLAVNGSLGGALTVGNGARLAGTGSVGNTVVQSGATLAPGGNSIGTLNMAGNLTLAQGSVYQLNAASDGRSDQIRVSGVAALQGGNVSVLASGNFQPTTRYSILTANGGVSGQFAGATTDMAFLNPFLTYSPQNVTLRLQRNDVSFQNIAQTPNQRATAGAVAALDTGPLYSAVVQLNAANARTAFDSLSGEVHASLKSAAFEDSRFVRNASLGRLRESFDTPAAKTTDAPAASGSGVWAQAFDSWGSTDADGNASSLERTTRGIFLGADTRVGDDWRLGVLGGYSKSRVTPDDRPSLAKTDTYHVGVYGGKQWGQLGLRAGATYSAGEADTRRDIAFPGFSGQTAAKYDINTTQAFGELGWKMPTANGSLEPFAGLAHVKLSTDGFTESGGVAGLSGSSSSAHTTYSTLGLRGTTNAGMPNNQTRLRGLVGWRHAFGDVTPTSTLALAGQPGFAVAGVPFARNALVLEGGIDFAVSRHLTMGVSYVGQVASQLSDHGIKASLLWKF